MTPGHELAWGWVAHLRGGGTTSWSAWQQAGEDSREPSGRVLPGAQQLELLRHLNLAAARTGHRVAAVLAERVLTASAPGRGSPDFELLGAVEPSRFGPGPVDPGDLPTEELVRVATLLLAEDVLSAGAAAPSPEPRRPRRWRASYHLGGDSWLADPARAHLVAHGRPPGGPDAVAVLLGADLATMLVDAWTARCFGAGAPPWRAFLRDQVTAGRLPPRADLVRAADRWAGRVGTERVTVVLDPRHLPALVGVRRPLPRRPDLAAHATELARLVGPALGLLATPARVAQLLTDVLLPRLSGVPGDRLVLPAGRVGWARRQALRQREGLLRGGYSVHGDLDLLLPTGHTGVPVPSERAVLDLALRLLLEGAAPEAAADRRGGHR